MNEPIYEDVINPIRGRIAKIFILSDLKEEQIYYMSLNSLNKVMEAI